MLGGWGKRWGLDALDHPGGVADGDDVRGNVPGDDGACADHAVVTDGDAWTDDDSAAEPDVVTDGDRLCGFQPVPARLGLDWMRWGEQLDVWPDLAVPHRW